MLLFLTIAGGVALILFGVRFLRKGLDRLFGPQVGQMMQRLTRSRLRALFTGLTLSLAAPSSTTISVLAVQAVQAGHLAGRRMLAVMFGANIGLTLMVLLIALRLERELRDRHFDRLKSGLPQTHESSAVHLDVLTHLKRVNNNVTHVAYAVLNGAVHR